MPLMSHVVPCSCAPMSSTGHRPVPDLTACAPHACSNFLRHPSISHRTVPQAPRTSERCSAQNLTASLSVESSTRGRHTEGVSGEPRGSPKAGGFMQHPGIPRVPLPDMGTPTPVPSLLVLLGLGSAPPASPPQGVDREPPSAWPWSDGAVPPRGREGLLTHLLSRGLQLLHGEGSRCGGRDALPPGHGGHLCQR